MKDNKRAKESRLSPERAKHVEATHGQIRPVSDQGPGVATAEEGMS